MNREAFVQNIKFYCERRGVKPTNACKDAGVGTSFVTDIKRGQTPSVEKVEMLAHYLGVTVSELIGETQPGGNRPAIAKSPPQENLVLHDSAVVVHPTDVKRLTVGEVEMIMAYRRASEYDRGRIDMVLDEYKKGTTSGIG